MTIAEEGEERTPLPDDEDEDEDEGEADEEEEDEEEEETEEEAIKDSPSTLVPTEGSGTVLF